jgi:FMN reductase
MSDETHAVGHGRPLVVGIGGTTRAASSTDRALRLALQAAEAAGAHIVLFDGAFLSGLPHYAGYHGGVSGLVKNALDLLDDLRDDKRSYLDGRAVGCIATAAGWQASVSTLAALRSIVHALRGWPTPLGVTLNTSEKPFEAAGGCTDEKVAEQLATVARQVVEFAQKYRR